jgi:hypothetical protein
MVHQKYVANNSRKNILVKRLNYWLKRKMQTILRGKNEKGTFLKVKKGIKKGEQKFTFFCPKSTMNLTYLCYGESNVDLIC